MSRLQKLFGALIVLFALVAPYAAHLAAVEHTPSQPVWLADVTDPGVE